MKLVKSLLLGSAAGLCAAGAQAADLRARAAAPAIEYVRVCTAYGAGFFYIPGTDTCIRVGGRASYEYQIRSMRSRNDDISGFRGRGRLSVDTRTQTAFGTLRTFVRFDLQQRTGGYLASATQTRFGNTLIATGQDYTGRVQKFVEVDSAYIQFAGFTAGRANSFYDFYAHSLEIIGASISSDVASTNLLAYTMTLGGGLSATLSMEDPTARRSPTFGVVPTIGSGGLNSLSPTIGSTFVPASGVALSPVGLTFAANGVPLSAANLDVIQRNYLPDFVGNVRYDAAWGTAQVSAAVHELRTGLFNTSSFGVNGGTAIAGQAIGRVPSAEYGWAVQGGLKLNLPQIAPGDQLWLQAAYAHGAGSYTNVYGPQGSASLGSTYTNRFAGTNAPGGYDMAIDTNGRKHLTDTWSGTVAYLHYWSPEWRQAAFATYGRAEFSKALRGAASPLVGVFANAAGTPINVAGGNGIFSGFGKDYSNLYAGTNLVWSPVKDLDIGVEGVYQRIEFLGSGQNARVVDSNKAVILGTQTVNGVVINVPKTVKFDDNGLLRMRIVRDF